MRERRCRRHIVSNLTFSSFSFYSTIFLAVFCYFSFRTFNVVIVRLTIRCHHTFDDRERRDKGCDGLRRESCEIAKTKRITRRSSRVKIICCIFFFLHFLISVFLLLLLFFLILAMASVYTCASASEVIIGEKRENYFVENVDAWSNIIFLQS